MRGIKAFATCVLLFPLTAYAADIEGDNRPTKLAMNGVGSESARADAPPVLGQVGLRSTDVFGAEGGYFHPFLSVAGLHTDNVYNTDLNKKSDYATTVSPGFWLAAPGSKQKILELSTSNTAPGGLVFSTERESFQRYQAYLYGSADFLRYDTEDAANANDYRGEGYLQYNLRGGLSLELIDQYVRGHDPLGTGESTQLDKYKTNLFDTVVSYALSKKTKVKANYSHYYVGYDAVRNSARDRDDNSVGAGFFYAYSPKTTVFLDYEFINISYDTGALSGSEEHQAHVGAKWDITGKTTGILKVGYTKKDFDRTGLEDADSMSWELRLNYILSPKTSLQGVALRSLNETTIGSADYTLTQSGRLTLTYRFSPKISAGASASYTNDDYKGIPREDDIYAVTPHVQYSITEWLLADAAYTYSERDSNIDAYDYDTNSVFIRLTAAY